MTVGQIFAKLGLDPKEYEKGLKQAETQADKAGSRIGNIFKNAFSVTIGMGMFEALKRGFKETIGTAIEFNSMLQTAKIGFTTMLGSAEKAQAFLDNMADFAAKTPFEYPDLLDAAKKMLAYGFAAENVLPTLRAVGDAAAALGTGNEGIGRITLALGQIRAKGKLSGEEMRQLTEAGIPAWHMLAEAMETTVPVLQDMVSKGLVPGDKAVEMLTQGMTQRFGGMMQQMEDTWQGVTSSIKDIWQLTIGEITKGLFGRINEWLIGVRDFADQFYTALKAGGLDYALRATLGPAVADIASFVGRAVSAIGQMMTWLYNIVRANWGIIRAFLITWASYTVYTKAASAATAIFQLVSAALQGTLASKIPVLSTLSTAVGIYKVQLALAAQQGIVMTGVMAKLRLALYALHSALGPVGWLLILISGLVAGGMHLWNKYKQSLQKTPKVPEVPKLGDMMGDLGGATKQATGAIDDQTKSLKKLKREASRTLTPLDELHKIEKKMAGADGGIEPIDFDFGFDADSFFPDIDEAFFGPDGLVGAFEELTEHATIKGFFEWLWESWSEWVQSWTWLDPIEDAIIEFFVVTLPEAWRDFKRWIAKTWEDIKKGWNDFWDDVKKGWNDFWDDVKKGWDDFVLWLKGVWEKVKAPWIEFWLWIKNKWDDLWQSLKKAWDDFVLWLKGVWEKIKAPWVEFWLWVKNKWNGLKESVKGIWDDFILWLKGTWEKVKAPWVEFWLWVKNKWNGLKESVRGIWDDFVLWLKGVWEKVKAPWSEFWLWVKNWGFWKTIQEKVEWLKKLFDFEWKLPKIKTPKFSVTWDTSGHWGSIGQFLGMPGRPNLKITWLAKGGIVGNTTLIGAGEAGREAVLPLDRNTEWADIVADKLANSLERTGGEGPLQLQIIVGGNLLLDEIIDAAKRKNARAGKTVIQLGV
jgi:tape measure domain-containing protein